MDKSFKEFFIKILLPSLILGFLTAIGFGLTPAFNVFLIGLVIFLYLNMFILENKNSK